MGSIINLRPYVNPGNAVPGVDIAAGLRWLGDQEMQRSRMAQQQSQFDTTEGRVNREHADQVAHEQRIEHDINARFGVSLEDHQRERDSKIQLERQQKAIALTNTARAAVAKGDWNAAEGLSGTLADLGVHVNKGLNPDGTPWYRFENPHEHQQTGESFDQIMSKVTGSAQQPTEQISAPQAQPNVQQLDQSNPYDGMLPGRHAEELPAQSQEPAQQQSQVPPEQDPYRMDASQLSRMNSMRLDPILSGIQGAFPGRFQSQIGNLLQGYKSLNADPNTTLDQLQKPMDTAARLYGAELGAEGNMARASIGQGGQASTEARMRENEAVNRAQDKAVKTGLYDQVKAHNQFASIRARMLSKNPAAQADAVKEMIGLREGGRITDQDFQIGFQGIASNIDQLKSKLASVYQSGLKDWQVANLVSSIDMIQKNNEGLLKRGAQDMANYAQSFRYEPEVYGVNNWIRGNLPQEYWPENIQKFNPQANAGGRPVRTPNVTSSASVTAPTTQEAVKGLRDLDPEVDEILGTQ